MASTVVFKSLTGRNFLRFGNQDFFFEFRKGLTGLFGNNGLGKSSIVDGLCICLFNETYRDSNKEDWVNNINKKGLYLCTKVDIVNGSTTDEYSFIQDFTTSKKIEQRRIIKNGEVLVNVVNIQEEIEKILGFNLNLFKNSIAVSADIPFISMTPEQKRQFSDNLFSVKQVSIFKKKASEALSGERTSQAIMTRDIENFGTKIVEYTKMIEASNVDNTEKVLQLKNDIANIEQALPLYEDKITSIEKKIEEETLKLNEKNPISDLIEVETLKLNEENPITKLIQAEEQKLNQESPITKLIEAETLKLSEDHELVGLIASEKTKLVEANNKLALLEQVLKDLKPEMLQQKNRELDSQLAVSRNEYMRIGNDIKKIVPNVPCFTCGNSFTEQTALEHINKHKIEQEQHKSEGIRIKGLLEESKKDLEKVALATTAIADQKIAIRAIQDNITKLNTDLNEVKHIIQNNIAKLKNDLTNEKNEIRNNINKLNNDLNVIKNGIQTNINKLNTELNAIKHAIQLNITKLKGDLTNAKSALASQNEIIQYRIKEIEKIENGEDNTSAIELAKSSIIECTSKKQKAEADLIDVVKKIDAYEYIIKMCSDTGIKMMLMKKFIPFLNKLINEYLTKFNLAVTVTFDEHFKHSIATHPGIGHKHSLLSKGQKKRIDVAILFAIVDLIKMMGNFKCNLLFLDEFADGNVDSNGFADIVNMIRALSDRDGKSIVVVSHKNEEILYDNLDYMYELQANNMFSVLKEVKI